VVREYQSLHENQIGKLLLLQHVSLVALLITLVLEALIIFYPLLRSVRSLTHDLNKAALTDPLTAINNRRGFQGSMEVALKNTDNTALMILDIDHFKSVNDEHGHIAGDRCIQHLVKLINMFLKEGDVIGRIGGEEFAVLLSNTSLPAAIATAEELRRAVENTPCELKDIDCEADSMSVTVSVGLVLLTSKSKLSDILQQADKLLYQAKNTGRNQVVLTEANRSFQRAA
jgi:diguanylate cyclase (GGDEF)-like protein